MIQLHFTVPPEKWIQTLCRDDLATVKILSMKSQKSNEVTHFVDIVSDKTSAEKMSKDLRRSSELVSSELVNVGSNRLVGAVTNTDCHVCSAIMNLNTGYFVGPAVTESDCRVSLQTVHEWRCNSSLSPIAAGQ